MIDKPKKSDRIVKRCCREINTNSIFVATTYKFVKLINYIKRKYKWVLLHKK